MRWLAGACEQNNRVHWRRITAAHAAQCPECSERRKRVLAPILAFGALAPIGMPGDVRRRIGDALHAHWGSGGAAGLGWGKVRHGRARAGLGWEGGNGSGIIRERVANGSRIVRVAERPRRLTVPERFAVLFEGLADAVVGVVMPVVNDEPEFLMPL